MILSDPFHFVIFISFQIELVLERTFEGKKSRGRKIVKDEKKENNSKGRKNKKLEKGRKKEESREGTSKKEKKQRKDEKRKKSSK